jgi:hypothetical protein
MPVPKSILRALFLVLLPSAVVIDLGCEKHAQEGKLAPIRVEKERFRNAHVSFKAVSLPFAYALTDHRGLLNNPSMISTTKRACLRNVTPRCWKRELSPTLFHFARQL